MVKFINHFGGEMWVADDRVDEYKAAGFKLAAEHQKAEKPAESSEPRKTRKTTKK